MYIKTYVKTLLLALGMTLLMGEFWPAAAQASYPVLDADHLATDLRFGFGGRSVAGIDYLGIPVYRRWGENGNADAQQALERGAITYFVVGKIDMQEYSALNRGVDWQSHGPRCRRSETDATLVPCVEVPHTGIPNHQDWEQIPTLGAAYPGQIWEIGNEPDWHPYHSPEEYAVWFHLYEQRIREVDPTAQIMIGGLLMCCGEGVYEHFQLRRQSWDEQIAAANTRHAWTTRFWHHHRELYGDYPRVDIWNIHPYAQAIGHGEFHVSSKVQTTVQRIVSFLDFLPSLPSPAGSPPEHTKPVYITEIGILGPEGSFAQETPCATRGCLTQAEFEYEESRAMEYMDGILDWLETEPRITRWFWFHWHANPDRELDHVVNLNTFINARHSFFQDVDEPNRAAIRYAKRAGSPVLYNRSFEAHTVAGAPYGWIFWASGPGDDYGYGVDTNEQRTGEKSLYLRAGAQAGEFGRIASARQPIASQHYNGQLARVEVWCKTAEASLAGIKVNRTNAAGVRDTSWTPSRLTPVACPDWQKIHTEWFRLPPDTVSLEVELSARPVDGSGSAVENAEVWFDDVALVLAGDLNRSLAVTADDLAFLIQFRAEQLQLANAAERVDDEAAEDTVTSFPAAIWKPTLAHLRMAAELLAVRLDR